MGFKNNALCLLLFIVVVTLADDKVAVNIPKTEPAGDPQPKPTPLNVTTPAPPTTPTSAPTTTPEPTTTPKPPTPPTPPTTTPKPPTPPTPPTTTPKPPTPPTPPPTTPAPTPTPTTEPPKPTSTPAPKSTDWVVPGTNNTYCIVASMKLKLTVPYKAGNKTVKSEIDISNKDSNVKASGSCTGNETLVLTWDNGTATFTFDANNKTYSLMSVDFVIKFNNKTFPGSSMVNVTDISFKHDASVFSLPLKHSYTCANLNALTLNGTALNGSTPVANATFQGTLALSNVHIQAFGTSKDAKFDASMDCTSAETPDIVPIAVGLILAGLVVVVLVAYLVGRRRAQGRGYVSM